MVCCKCQNQTRNSIGSVRPQGEGEGEGTRDLLNARPTLQQGKHSLSTAVLFVMFYMIDNKSDSSSKMYRVRTKDFGFDSLS